MLPSTGPGLYELSNCMNGHWPGILTAQPPMFSAFTHPRMTLLLSPKFLSHSLCQAIFPSWSELSPEQKFPTSLLLLAERWNYQPSRARQMKSHALCEAEGSSQQGLSPFCSSCGGHLVPQLSPTITHASQRQEEHGSAPALSKQLRHDELSFYSLTLVLDSQPEWLTLPHTLIAALTRAVYDWLHGSETTQTTPKKESFKVNRESHGTQGSSQVTIVSHSVSVPPLLSEATCSCISASFCRAESYSPMLNSWLPLLLHGFSTFSKLWLMLTVPFPLSCCTLHLKSIWPFSSNTHQYWLQSLACWFNYSTEKKIWKVTSQPINCLVISGVYL